jgi:hypothetical protein
MYILAVFFDLLDFIPIPAFNMIVDPIAAFALGIAGMETGTNIYASEEITATLIVLLIKFIPIIDMFPTYTIRVYLAKKAIKKRKEEQEAAEEANLEREIEENAAAME